jgi:hypothetical protein
MTSELTKKQALRLYVGMSFVTSLLMILALTGFVILVLHIEPCRIPPAFGLWGLSVMGFVGALGTVINLARLSKSLGSVEEGDPLDRNR